MLKEDLRSTEKFIIFPIGQKLNRVGPFYFIMWNLFLNIRKKWNDWNCYGCVTKNLIVFGQPNSSCTSVIRNYILPRTFLNFVIFAFNLVLFLLLQIFLFFCKSIEIYIYQYTDWSVQICFPFFQKVIYYLQKRKKNSRKRWNMIPSTLLLHFFPFFFY